MKVKFTKKKVIAAAAVVVVVGIAGSVVTGLFPGSTSLISRSATTSAATGSVRATKLEKRDLTSTISATGTIYSAETTPVYSDLTYPIAAVYVEVGDVVEAGDLLAVFDTSSLEAEIKQKEASANKNYEQAQLSLEQAQRELEVYQSKNENGYNSSLINAEKSVADAEVSVLNAELEVETATNDLSTARRNLSDARNSEGDYEDEDATDSQIASLRDTVSSREASLEKAQMSLEQSRADLEDAKLKLEIAKVEDGTTLEDYELSIRSAEISANMEETWLSIQSLKEDLADAEVTATVSGTITEVNAEVSNSTGSNSGGSQLFVIQNTEQFKVITNIQEYDLGDVSVGDRVIITTDATGDKEFEGTLTRVDPTSTLTTAGDLTTSTEATYQAEISMNTSDPVVRVGMNAVLSIVTEEVQNVYTVSYEAIGTDGNGQDCVFAAVQQPDGTYIAEAIPVKQGMESDLYVAIEGDGLSEDLLIVNSATSIQAGQTLNIADESSDAAAPDNDSANAAQGQEQGGMMGMGGMMGGGGGGGAPGGGGGGRP